MSTREAIVDLQKLYPEKRSALIPALHLAQEECGYLPDAVQVEVADLFELNPIEVRGVVSFYDMFHEQPGGDHTLHVCTNLSCMLRGGDRLYETCASLLNVDAHGRSADGTISLIESECLAACDRAPVLLVDHRLVGPVAPEELSAVIEQAKQQHTARRAPPFRQKSLK